MPEWIGNAQCNKFKKKGHLSFNCPPKFINQKRKTPKLDRYMKYKKNDDKPNTKQEETATVAKVEFAGYTTCISADPKAESAFLTHFRPPVRHAQRRSPIKRSNRQARGRPARRKLNYHKCDDNNFTTDFRLAGKFIRSGPCNSCESDRHINICHRQE